MDINVALHHDLCNASFEILPAEKDLPLFFYSSIIYAISLNYETNQKQMLYQKFQSYIKATFYAWESPAILQEVAAKKQHKICKITFV